MRPSRRAPLRGWIHLACPLCVMAMAVSLVLGVAAVTAIVLDHARSLQQADLGARYVADRAGQRVAELFGQIDVTLRAVAHAADEGTRGAALETLLAERRRGEPRLLGLYVTRANGDALASSASVALRSVSPVAACLRDIRPERGQMVLHPIALAVIRDGAARDGLVRDGLVRPQGGVLQALCAIRPLRAGDALLSSSDVAAGAGGLVVAVIGEDAIEAHFADLLAGPRSRLLVRDETGQVLAQIDLMRRLQLAGSTASETAMPVIDAQSSAAPTAGAQVLTQRIDAPIPVTLTVEIVQPEILAAWWRRSALLASSAIIVIGFLGLAALAVRRYERRETERLQLLAGVGTTRPQAPDPAGVMAQLIADAQALVPCEALPADRPDAAQLAADLQPVLLAPDLLRIGSVQLRRTGARGFTESDLAALRLRADMAEAALARGQIHRASTSHLEQHRLEASQMRSQLETLLLEMSEAMFTLDTAWRFTGSNRNAERLFEEYKQDLHGCSIWEIFPELVGTAFETECRRAARERHPVSFELQWLRSDHWLTVRAFPRAGPDAGLAIYLQDITTQVAADDKLREAAKMEAMGRLTGGIAHDYNNLLTVILGNTEMLDVELPESDPNSSELRDMLAQITRAAQNAAELTHQLLAFARRQTLAPRDVDVARLTQGLDGLLRRSLGTAVTLDIRCPPALWHAHVDPTQLENAIVNLVINARDAMPQGGRLVVETANLAVRKAESDQLGEIGPGNYVVVSVSDTGRGIPKDIIGKVFEPFFSTKPPGRASGRGTGLGLSMVYGFVTQSGGNARITSEVGRGTTVRLYLPAVREAALEASGPGRLWQPDPVLPGGNETILLVEDSEMVRQFAETVLTGLGYQVHTAEDGASALALIERGLAPDLLLTDVLLPGGMDGVAVADRVLARQRERNVTAPRVLFMSGYVDSVDAHQGRLHPDVNLLLKPFRRAALACIVRTHLDRPAEAPD